jgi:hemolysin III
MIKLPFDHKTETINSITHALGILFGIIFIPILTKRSFQCDSTIQIIGTIIYQLFFMATFVFSTLYHAFHKPALKVKFRVLDHISIYFFIAATYTPFVLHYMYNKTGIILLILVWFFAITGSFFKLYFINRFALLSVISYVCMGLLFLLVRQSFFKNMPQNVITFIYFGVVLFLVGVIFFLWRRWKYHHALWHLLVLAGSICHFRAIWLSVR